MHVDMWNKLTFSLTDSNDGVCVLTRAGFTLLYT